MQWNDPGPVGAPHSAAMIRCPIRMSSSLHQSEIDARASHIPMPCLIRSLTGFLQDFKPHFKSIIHSFISVSNLWIVIHLISVERESNLTLRLEKTFPRYRRTRGATPTPKKTVMTRQLSGRWRLISNYICMPDTAHSPLRKCEGPFVCTGVHETHIPC